MGKHVETFLFHTAGGFHPIILILYLTNLLDCYNFSFSHGLSMEEFI